MTSCPDDNALARLLDGAIDENARVAIESHLDRCEACAAVLAELALATPPADVPTHYRLMRQLGAGAMGTVWEAEHSGLGRRVALKLVRPDVASDPQYRARMLREARAIALVRHPNVVSCYESGELGDGVFLALELIAGVDERAWRAAATRSTAEILGVWRQVGAGLMEIHRAGIVHRDLKPENVVVADDGRVVIVDFGLATGTIAVGAWAVTTTGQIIGTPSYMALEQLRGEPATAKSDQFTFCVCLWEALCGARPFPPRPTVTAQALALMQPPSPPPRGDRRVFEALARGLAADAERRWASMADLVAALNT
jgi:serine/threonine protein kinase